MFASIVSSAAAFIGTNIDDILILMLLFASAQNARERRGIVAGQYLGIGILTAVSLVCAYALKFVPQGFIGWLGLVPIALSVKEWISYLREKRSHDGEEESPRAGSRVLGTALLTIANGADNVGVYIPLFAGFGAAQVVAAVAVFALMVALWCLLAQKLASLPALKAWITRYKHIIVPVVFIALGVYIILENTVW